ncbi:hypothetical protein P5673_022236 [Acropora cervicornis]|uniref:Mutator-like transposase domain-containing protein n=1 Tax=Acropora cervicornis TaxID=6130 RepID=A0AAD9Q7W4_ACRCE|nr:hypothetical protein P5673_022236 [Acropora cervicornis]
MLHMFVECAFFYLKSMEAEGAARLYGRSIEKQKFRYIPFVWEGDRKSYSSICKSLPYGAGVTIPKEDCIGHVTKRMGTALRKVKADYGGKKLADGKGIGGQG